jgi:ribonucleotide reductase alpha subunit
VLAAGCASAAVVKQFNKVDKYIRNIDDLEKEKNFPDEAGYEQWRKKYNKNVNDTKKYETQRNIYIGGAGGLFLAGTLTFLF